MLRDLLNCSALFYVHFTCLNPNHMTRHFTVLLLFATTILSAQNTFQKIYNYPATVQNFGAYQTSDGNYIMTGIANAGGYRLYVSKEDCEGNFIWSKTYNPSSTVGNISQRVIETSTGHYLLAGSSGSFNAYNIAVVKMDDAGNSIWKKVINGGGDDVVNAVIETSDKGYVVAGKTNSWGQDAGTAYCDVYLAKLDSAGNLQWGKTFGTQQNYDEAFDVTETSDHGLAVTGRYINNGAFHCLLLKTDSIGTLKYIKAYGDSNHNTTGFAIIETAGGGFAITGSTTVLKNSFQDYPDVLLLAANANGDTLWTRAWHGTNSDGSENGSSLLMTPDGGFAMGVATFSYPTVGFVPNKHMVLRTDNQGHMMFAKTYNNGGSHYPYLVRARDGLGYLLSGFSNHYTPDFNPMLIRTDSLFASGCNETDVTPLTVEQQPDLVVAVPPVDTASGGSMIVSTMENSFSFTVTSLCENIVDSCTVSSGLADAGNPEDIRIFPNPSDGKFLIMGTHGGSRSIELIDPKGRLVLETVFSGTTGIDVTGIPAGLYVLKATIGNRTITRKLVIQPGY
jgi:hypothetical protein